MKVGAGKTTAPAITAFASVASVVRVSLQLVAQQMLNQLPYPTLQSSHQPLGNHLNAHSVGDGMQQALDYAETLNIPFAFSSNGDAFVFHDRTGASRPREALINENSDLVDENQRYVMRIVFTKYGLQARAVLDALLTRYADEGILNLDDANVLRLPPLNQFGTPVELINAFGGKPGFEQAVHDLQDALYRESA